MPQEICEDPQPGRKVNNIAVRMNEDIDVVGEGNNETDDSSYDHNPRLDQIFCVGVFLDFQHVFQTQDFMKL